MAPPSCLAATYRAPPVMSPATERKFPLPTTPKAALTPSSARACPTAVASFAMASSFQLEDDFADGHVDPAGPHQLPAGLVEHRLPVGDSGEEDAHQVMAELEAQREHRQVVVGNLGRPRRVAAQEPPRRGKDLAEPPHRRHPGLPRPQ